MEGIEEEEWATWRPKVVVDSGLRNSLRGIVDDTVISSRQVPWNDIAYSRHTTNETTANSQQNSQDTLGGCKCLTRTCCTWIARRKVPERQNERTREERKEKER